MAGLTILDKLNRVPPCVCRLLARRSNGRHGLSHAEIASKSGLSRSMVSWLSHKNDWNGVSIDTVVAFAMACGVNHLKMERQMDYIRRRKMTHIDSAGTQQKRFYLRLMALNHNSVK